MLLATAKQPWSDPEYLVELKADGYRLMVDIEADQVKLSTRRGTDATKWYPELVYSLAGLTKRRTVLDGEVVVLDEIGRTDFERVHARSRRRRRFAGADLVTFIAFDVLVANGRDVRHLELLARKALLAKLLAKRRPQVLLSQYLPGDQAPELFERVLLLKLEGIVMKKLDSPYVGGEPRSDYWFKIKRPNATPAGKFTRDVDISLQLQRPARRR
ncbi:hypothetical protein [Roseateles asaccharophilus]|uniref:ATP-dependent DNA ligase n=1 Tax=Roseateles asaccharophilus TaxID=582607 RepID=UPI00384CF4B5